MMNVASSLVSLALAFSSILSSAEAIPSVKVSKHKPDIKGGALEIVIRDLPEGSVSLFAIRSGSAAPHIVIGRAELPNSSRGIAGPWSVSDLNSFSINPGSVLIDARDLTHLKVPGLLVYAAVPQGTRVTITSGSAFTVRSAVTDSLLVRNGTVLDEPLRGFNHAVMRLLQPPLPEMPMTLSLADGTVVVSVKNLKDHVLEIPSPATIANSCQCTRTGVLTVEVKADGLVGQITSSAELADIVQTLKPYTSGWRFRPFLNEGSPTRVKVPILIRVLSDGKLLLLP